MTSTEQTVHEFLTDVTGEKTLTSDQDLIAAGLLDSLTMMDLVVFIEMEFQHRIAVSDMRPDRFRTIQTIAKLIDEVRQDRA